jgi:ABC-2 type transport system permease protein
MSGLGTYLRLEVLRALRNRRYVVFTLGFPLLFYLLFTGIYDRQARAAGLDFDALYMVSMAAYGALGAALNTNGARLAMERAGGWARQLRVTPLSAPAYVLAKTLTALVAAGPAVLLVSLAGVAVHGVRLSAGAWAAYLAGTWLGALPFAVLGVLAGYLFDSDSAQGGALLLYFVLAILGGMWFPVQVMPKVMADAARLLPSYHYAALGWNAVTGQPIGWGHLAVLVGYGAAFAALAAWRYRHDEAREYA